MDDVPEPDRGGAAKYTAEPARVHGIEREVGSLRPGSLADIVLWRPTHFGVRPELVLKGGWFAWAASGAGNASVEGAEPRRYGPHWAAQGTAAPALCATFVSGLAAAAGIGRRLESRRRFVTVHGTRSIRRDGLSPTPPTCPWTSIPQPGRCACRDAPWAPSRSPPSRSAAATCSGSNPARTRQPGLA